MKFKIITVDHSDYKKMIQDVPLLSNYVMNNKERIEFVDKLMYDGKPYQNLYIDFNMEQLYGFSNFLSEDVIVSYIDDEIEEPTIEIYNTWRE